MTNQNAKTRKQTTSKKQAKLKVPKTKTIKIQKFNRLVNKPPQPKKGISYAVEKAENIDTTTGKKMKGDIFKKYENGVLKRQIFIPKSSVKKIVQKGIRRTKNKKIGGRFFGFGKKTPPRVIYVEVPAKGPVQAPVLAAPPAQAPANTVVIQDGTTFGQALKTGVATGVGWGIGEVIIGSIFGDY